MRYILSAITLVALVLTGTAAQAPADALPAPHRDAHCVTKHEYKKAHKHLRMRKVQRIFDTSGKVKLHQTGTLVKRYRFCKRAAHQADARRFNVMYNDWPKPIDLRRKYCGRAAPHQQACF